ncbi:MAG: dTMP kinase, partial [Plesiomonas shigelloides]
PALGLQRARQRGELDRIEQQDLSFFERTRVRYLELAQNDPNTRIIDAGQALPVVTAAIEATLNQWLDAQGL